MYWFFLTAWYLFSVWSAMSTKSRRQQPVALPDAKTLDMRLECVDVLSAQAAALGSDGNAQGSSRQSGEVVSDTRLNVLRSVGPDQCARVGDAAASKAATQVMPTPFSDLGQTDSAAAAVPAAAAAAAAAGHVHSRSLDIIKVRKVPHLHVIY
jgi:hypothetical protein